MSNSRGPGPAAVIAIVVGCGPGPSRPIEVDANEPPSDAAAPVSCVEQIAGGFRFSCALKADGTVWCWGDSTFGQLGVPDGGAQPTPTQVPGLDDVRAIATGGHHACAIRADSTLWCWGLNSSGQLGDGTTDGQSCGDPIQPQICRFEPVAATAVGSGVVAVAAGSTFTCAGFADGHVACWGANSTGQLGDATGQSTPSPVTVGAVSSSALSLTAGRDHACALDQASGTLWCWGSNQFGKLGTGIANGATCAGVPCEKSPLRIEGIAAGVAAVTAGSHQTCAIDREGKVWCWGLATYGGLGNGGAGMQVMSICGTSDCAPTPIVVEGLADVRAIASGSDHVCATSGTGSVSCWGNDSYGQLGDGQIDAAAPWGELRPVNVAVGSADLVGAGYLTSCALDRDGGITCWGHNELGQIGDGTLQGEPCGLEEHCRPTPTAVALGCTPEVL